MVERQPGPFPTSPLEPGPSQGVMANKQGQKPGTQRGNRQRFPYEPRVVGGKLMMPAELQTIHRYVLETPVLEAVTEENKGSGGDCLA